MFQRAGGELLGLYEQYVTEPEERRDVYGYWAFVAGYLLGMAGVVAFLLFGAPQAYGARQTAIALAALGLPLALFGIVLFLPVRRQGVVAGAVGVAISLFGIIGFLFAYPQDWLVAADYSAQIITVYTLGVAIVTGVAAMIPVATGEKGLLVEPVTEAVDSPAVMVGDATRGATFAAYQVDTGQWSWRLVRQDAVAENATATHSRPDVEGAIEAVRTRIGTAGLLEITTAAFRLYGDDDWEWALMREDGSAVAASAGEYADRGSAEESVGLLKEYGPEAEVIDIRDGAFDCYRDGGRWRWRLVDDDHVTLARGQTAYDGRSNAEAAADRAARVAEGARTLSVETLGVELYDTDDGWRWRVVDADDERLVTGARTHDSRRAAEAAVEDLLPAAESASVVEAGVAAYEVYREGGRWHWRLVDDEETVVARSHGDGASGSAAETDADRMAATVESADVIEIDDAAFETYPDGEEWHWRLVTEDRTVIAESTAGHPDEGAAGASIERVTAMAAEADLIEFDHAAFQQYETDHGEWRWRLIDEDGNVMADSGEGYESREAAGDAMRTLKEHAPDADVLEIETAAFELFEDDDGWGWRLIDAGGRMVAESAAAHPSRAAARDAMAHLFEPTTGIDIRAMENAAFQVYTDDADEWRWQYVHPAGSVLADGTEGHGTRDEVEAAIADVRAAATGAPKHAVDPVAVQLVGDGDRDWRYRLIDRDREPIAESERRFEDRDVARAEIERLQRHAPDATVFALRDGVVRLSAADGGWHWELIDEDRTVVATAPDRYGTREAAESAADRMRQTAPTADLMEIDDAAFELFEDDEGWRWAFLDADQTRIATGTTVHDDPEAVRRSLGELRDLVADASVLEIDDATFEFHRREEGWIWRLVDENGDPLAESVERYPSRGEARAAMETIKEHAPAARTSVVE